MPIEDKFVTPLVKQNILRRKNRSTRKSHSIQQSAFVTNILNLHLVDEKTCVIELGAGKGELGFMIHQATKCDLVLLDMNVPRRPVDPLVPIAKFHRILGDATKYEYEKNVFISSRKKFVIVAKHLCGCIIDQALSRILNAGILPTAIVFSPCCFSKMDKSTFPGFSAAEVEFIARKSIWGTFPLSKIYNGDKYLPVLNRIGILYQYFLNLHRLQFLRDKNYKIDCFNYVPYDITPANMLIIAKEPTVP